MGKGRMYKAHCENLKMIEIALVEIENSLKNSIKKEEHDKELVYTRLLSFLIGCWIEVRLLKLIYELNAFTDDEITNILGKSSLNDSWKTTIRIAVSKKCGIEYQDEKMDLILHNKLPFTIRHMYSQILDWVEEYLRDMYEMRNKIAHGQWVKAFTNDLSGFSSERTRDIKKTNIVSLQLKKSVLMEISYLLESLCASNVPKSKVKNGSVFEQCETAFEKNFEKSYKRINHLLMKRQADRVYENYKDIMVERYNRGITHKKMGQS